MNGMTSKRAGREQQAKGPSVPARQRHTAESVPGEFAGAAVTRAPATRRRVRTRGTMARFCEGHWIAVQVRGTLSPCPAQTPCSAVRPEGALGVMGKRRSMPMETGLETRLSVHAEGAMSRCD